MRLMWALLAIVAVVSGLGSTAVAQDQRFETSITVLGTQVEHPTVGGAAGDQILTFNAPVAVPGVSLAPGTYVFRFIAPSVMQVLPADRSDAYATFMTVRGGRESKDEYEVTLKKVHPDAPPRIVSLHFPYWDSDFLPVYPSAKG